VSIVTESNVTKIASQHGQHSKVYMRAPGETVTGIVEYTIGQTRPGQVLVARTRRGICAILFGEDTYELVADLSKHLPQAVLMRDDAAMFAVTQQVTEFIEAPFALFDAPLDIGGTLLQQQVWQALREIPAGQTLSYSDMASRIGRPESVRAVAGACAGNAIAVAIPCHRAVRNDGAISGYRWSSDRKEQLLRLEAQA
jgi:AraC family transcriptional regulator of adaptative response/methylated-DNA-[protein]-cysteine methyltransferase